MPKDCLNIVHTSFRFLDIGTCIIMLVVSPLRCMLVEICKEVPDTETIDVMRK